MSVSVLVDTNVLVYGQMFATFVEMQQRAEKAEHALSTERARVEEMLNRLRALGQEP